MHPRAIRKIRGLVRTPFALAVAGLVLCAALTGAAAPTTHAPVASDRPFGRFGLPLSIDPNSSAAQAAAAEAVQPRTTSLERTLRAARTIARFPAANWYGGSADTTRKWVRERVEAAAADGSVAQLVAFNLPNRGCGPVPEAGPTTSGQYKRWFSAFLDGLGHHRAIVIMEPDALGLATCLPTSLRLQRYALVRWAVNKLHAQGSWAYIDIGHSAWLPVRVAVNRLRAAGIERAAGFSLNVSNFRPTPELLRYGTAISQEVGGRHFVIDSGRNGTRTADSRIWCNPAGRGLGHAPTAHTRIAKLDAYLWIKPPGDTDGACNGAPASGWWAAYAAKLVRNARLRG